MNAEKQFHRIGWLQKWISHKEMAKNVIHFCRSKQNFGNKVFRTRWKKQTKKKKFAPTVFLRNIWQDRLLQDRSTLDWFHQHVFPKVLMHPVFTLLDPESVKNTVKSSVLFYTFRICGRKSCMYIECWWNWAQIPEA